MTAGCAVVLVVVCVMLRRRHDYPARHFGVVREGILYRSAQPEAEDWPALRDRYGIRTVIDLRGNSPDAAWAVAERNFCAENGIRLMKLPIGPDRLTDAELRTIVETVSDPKSQPVLVHCELGKSRTGVVIAAYRIVAQGWSCDAVLAEAGRYKDSMSSGYAAYLRELAAGRGWRPEITLDLGLPTRPRHPWGILQR